MASIILGLQCFEQDAPYRLEVALSWTQASLQLRYELTGDLHQLAIPPPGPAHFQDELWRLTCFEFFIQAAGDEGYEEWNLSPSSAWAHYYFADYRQRREATPLKPREALIIEAHADRLVLKAELPWPQAMTRSFRCGVTAVLKDKDGRMSYWALAHTRDKPDFHAAESFIASLERPLS